MDTCRSQSQKSDRVRFGTWSRLSQPSKVVLSLAFAALYINQCVVSERIAKHTSREYTNGDQQEEDDSGSCFAPLPHLLPDPDRRALRRRLLRRLLHRLRPDEQFVTPPCFGFGYH